MPELFTPRVRDRAIETTISNLVMAGLVEPEEVASYMRNLTKLSNNYLAEQMVASRLLLDKYYERNTTERKN